LRRTEKLELNKNNNSSPAKWYKKIVYKRGAGNPVQGYPQASSEKSSKRRKRE